MPFFVERMNRVRIPRDISLASYVRKLIAEDRIIEFYKTEDWLELRAEVLEEYHNECQECLKRGEYTSADCVHHVNEVKENPSLALSKTYRDKDGKEHAQLVPLCNRCHNKVHEKLTKWQRRDMFTNEEKW